ncbi:MAG: transcriptional regulator, GntR family [Sphingomonas bacterium]|nr:GntR family transcriptional regulator [Sphingomonas bacterium]MDB5689255.1 transcriptional regulator, GntR family [Sphingomonas bacterium]
MSFRTIISPNVDSCSIELFVPLEALFASRGGVPFRIGKRPTYPVRVPEAKPCYGDSPYPDVYTSVLLCQRVCVRPVRRDPTVQALPEPERSATKGEFGCGLNKGGLKMTEAENTSSAKAATAQAQTAEDSAVAAPAQLSVGGGVSLGDALHNALREEIAAGQLPPGWRLRETDVAKRFGISRTPVREALKKLQAESLLVQVPGRGLTVAMPSLSEILDDYLIREVLEGLGARLAAERALETDVMMMRSLLRQVEEAHEADDVDRAIALSYAFDRAVFEAARNPRLHRTIDAASAAQGVNRRGYIRDKVRRTAAIRERHRILAAIAARDPAAAELAAQEHLRSAREFRIAMTMEKAAAPNYSAAVLDGRR